MTQKNIIIVGSGVTGLTTAHQLALAGHKVTIVSLEGADKNPHTSDSAYAMSIPVAWNPDTRIAPFTVASRAKYTELSADKASGIELLPAIVLHRKTVADPWYSDLAGFRHATSSERGDLYDDGLVMENTPVIDPSTYLPYLRAKVIALGVTIQKLEVKSFDDLPAEYDAIVNCTGFGHRAITGDTSVFASRVQVVRVSNANNKHIRVCKTDDEDGDARVCIVPHEKYITIGGFFDGGETIDVDDSLTQRLLDNAMRVEPGLKVSLADVIEVRRAIRPERNMPLLDRTTTAGGRILVHSNGWDGMGYCGAWGSADWVVENIFADDSAA